MADVIVVGLSCHIYVIAWIIAIAVFDAGS
jgi:hypothetical protein